MVIIWLLIDKDDPEITDLSFNNKLFVVKIYIIENGEIVQKAELLQPGNLCNPTQPKVFPLKRLVPTIAQYP